MRCCSSVESRYSHSSSPNRRPETWPSQILSAKSFIFQNGAVTLHTHTFTAVWRGCWKPSKNSTNTSPATFLEDSAAWWSHSAELLFMCLCVCVFVYMWTLCCVLRFDITAWKNHTLLKVIIPFWEQSLVQGGYWGSGTAESSLNAVEWLAPQLQTPELKQNAWMEPCCSGRARNLNYPVQKMPHIYARLLEA